MRRIQLLSAVLLATTLYAPAALRAQRGLWRGLAEGQPPQMREGGSPQAPQTPQPPVFRGGTNLVQVDAIVTDDDRRPVTDLTAADFELLDDGKLVTIDRVRFLGAAEYPPDATLAPIRTHEDEERERPATTCGCMRSFSTTTTWNAWASCA